MSDVTLLFNKGKDIVGIKPNTLISDGASKFHTAFNNELLTNRFPSTRHINHIHLQEDHNNNKIEGINGEIRDREKTMHSLKKADTPILKSMRIYHNYIRNHQRLQENKSPAEKPGIVGGYNTTVLNSRPITLGGDVILKIDNKVIQNIHEILVYIEGKKN